MISDHLLSDFSQVLVDGLPVLDLVHVGRHQPNHKLGVLSFVISFLGQPFEWVPDEGEEQNVFFGRKGSGVELRSHLLGKPEQGTFLAM